MFVNKNKLLVTLLLLLRLLLYSIAQTPPFFLPCGPENLSCVYTDTRMCYSRAMLCDGVFDCPDGTDEGIGVDFLNCTGGTFMCPTGETISISLLCDGVADCSCASEDETSIICERKCCDPYVGGCHFNTCLSFENERICPFGFGDGSGDGSESTSGDDVRSCSTVVGTVLCPASYGGRCSPKSTNCSLEGINYFSDRHGPGVSLSDTKREITAVAQDYAMAYTALPIPVGQPLMLQVRNPGFIRFGLTTFTPVDGPLERWISNLLGNPNCWIWFKNEVWNNNVGLPINQTDFNLEEDNMEGQTLGMTAYPNGELHIFLDGMDIGTLWRNLPTDQLLYGMFGLENNGDFGASFVLTGCQSGYFQCSNCYCTPEYNECNGRNDCGDNSDENHCFNVVVEFESDSYVANERAGTVEVCLVKIGEITQELQVYISAWNFTPVESEDDWVVAPMVTFATSENRTCIEIGVTDDDIALEDESFSLTLSVPHGVSTGNITTSNVTIQDDDVLIIDFTSETYVMDESGRAKVCLETNTGIAVDLNILVTVINQMANISLSDVVMFQASSTGSTKCTSFDHLNTIGDSFSVVLELPSNPNVQSGTIKEAMVIGIVDEMSTDPVTEDGSNSDVTVIAAAVSTTVGAMLLILVIMSVVLIIFWRQRIKKRHRLNEPQSSEMPENHEMRTTPEYSQSSAHRYMDLPSGRQIQRSPRGASQYMKPMAEAKILIPGRHIQLWDSIGKGEFGVVYRGQLNGWENRCEVVAVKTVKGVLTPMEVDGIMKESLKMKDFNHPNVLNLIGVSIDAGESPYIVMPYMANGNLLSYLKKERPNLTIAEDASDEMATEARKTLLSMCLQIAKGMEYLAAKRVVHRDLAARNCMMDINHVIKVADFGLSESMYSKNYFREGKDEGVKLPVKWMAIESFQDGIFTEKTDVWSFGVTCWEVFSLGKTPYPGVDPFTLVKSLEGGQRLEKPTNAACSSEVFNKVLVQCWEKNPDNRPTFTDLVETISTHLEQISGYMEFSVPRDNQLTENEI